MTSYALFYFLLVVIVVVVAVWLAARRRTPADTLLGEAAGRLTPVIVAARRRAFIAVAFAVVVFLAGVAAGVTMPGLLGMPVAVAPLVASACGLLLYSATPPRSVVVPDDQPRTAGLARRSWLSVIPEGWKHASIEITVTFVALLIFFGVTAHTDDQGLSRSIRFEAEGQMSTATPYPGWFYGVPVLISLFVLTVATVVALQRIGAAAALPHPDDADADARWRTGSASVVLSLATGAVLFTQGGIATMAGLTMNNAVIAGSTPVVWDVIADVLVVIGVVSLILSVIAVTIAALNAVTIGDRVARAEGARR